MTVTVLSTEAGLRLDKFLCEKTEETRARIQSLIAEGCVTVNGGLPQKNGQPLKAGDVIEVSTPAPVESDAVAQNIPLNVVYEDDSLIVINKARGMVVHPAAGNHDGTLVNALLFHCGGLSGVGGAMRPGIVHRLDKQTTGLLVAAKNDAAHVALSQQIKDRSVERLYAALLLGSLKDEHISVDAPIGRHRTNRKKMAIVPDGRAAQTDFYEMQRLRSSTLTKCKLHTGRTHQIRVHAASIGHPVMGDDVYGPGGKGNPSVMLLHAYSLAFEHPLTKEELRFTAPPPEDYLHELKKLGWQGDCFW